MPYPPLAYRVTDPDFVLTLIRTYPFAHVITSVDGIRVTRLPVLADAENGRPVRLRSHLDARNPQVQGLDGAPVLVAFAGPAAYVSPNWRADKTKGGTYDYEEVQVRGIAHIVQEAGFFTRLVDDLSVLIEPQHAEIADYPVWRTSMARPGHIDRQLAFVTPFVIHIDSVEATAKMHQNFPLADRLSVAEHLARSHRDEVRNIAAKMRLELHDRPAEG